MSRGFDKRFEVDVLAGCANDKAYRRTVKRLVGEEEVWSTDANEAVWGVISKLGENDRLTGQIVARTIEKIESDDLAEAVVTVATRVLKRAESPKHKGYARDELRDWVRTSRAKRVMGEAVKHMKRGEIDDAEDLLGAIRRTSTLSAQYELSSWFDSFVARQEERIKRRKDPSRNPAIRTRFSKLDELLNGGLRQSQIGLVVAHTGRGKSATMNHLAFYGAAGGDLCLYISTEMNKELVDTRFDSKFHGFPISDFISARFSKREQERFFDKIDRLEKRLSKKLFTCSVPVLTMTPGMLEEMIDDVQQDTGEKVTGLFLDSPDHMRKNSRLRDERHIQAYNYWEVKRIVDEQSLACWATTQAPTSYINKLITAEGTAESVDKARIADVILTLNQTETERRANIIRGYLAKNRNGEAGKLLWFLTDWARMHIEETDSPTSATAP